jgi:hypothetical protein
MNARTIGEAVGLACGIALFSAVLSLVITRWRGNWLPVLGYCLLGVALYVTIVQLITRRHKHVEPIA